MVWLDLDGSDIELNRFIELGEQYGVVVRGGRFVVHYQIGEDAIQRVGQLFADALKGKAGDLKTGKIEHDPEELKLKGKGVE
jgi:threonine aldolase